MADDELSLQIDAGMYDLFRMEAEMHAATLENGLVELEGNPAGLHQIDELMRAAHSIKGAARIVGLDQAVGLAHAMEDFLTAVQAHQATVGAQAIDSLLRGVDLFKQLSGVPVEQVMSWLEQQATELRDLEQRLLDLRSGSPGEEAEPQVGCEPAGAAGTVVEPPPAAAIPAAAVESQPQPAAPPAPAEPSPAPERSVEKTPDHAVLVTADSINRLMGLAGECLVESRVLKSHVDNLYQLKTLLGQVPQTLEVLREMAAGLQGSAGVAEVLAEAFRKSGQCREFLSRQIETLEMYLLQWENLSGMLYNEAVATRMRPFRDGVQGFPRMVRDLARRFDKRIRLRITGETTPVDRDVLVKLEAPLTHILRNACDHGIEMPEERIAAGKSAEATIHLEAGHRAGMLSVTVSDDGRGVDPEQLRRKIVEKGLASAEIVADLRQQELLDFLFLAGFSTAAAVTETSGRGVGLNVVQSLVQEVQGSVKVSSEQGAGTTFDLQLPLTLSVIGTLLVNIAGEPYAFPLTRVDRVLMVPQEEIQVIEDHSYFSLEGQNIGLIAAHEALQLPAVQAPGSRLPVVVISDRLNRYGVAVEQLLGEHELVVRSLDPRLGKVPNVSAAAVKQDGSPVLILDVDDVVRSIDKCLSGEKRRKVDRHTVASPHAREKWVLVVDDSITVREVERRLLEQKGYQVEVAVDGMDGWNAVRSGRFDLVVSDIDMPRMNGIEMVKNIKRDPELKDLPIIIVSYKDREADRITGLEAGANYYLTKSSFYDESLVNAVVDLIGEAS